MFIKHASVLDQLCNHKQAISQWSTNPNAQRCCPTAINPSDAHWVLAGSLLTGLLPDDLSVIAEGSLLKRQSSTVKQTSFLLADLLSMPLLQAIEATFMDASIFETIPQAPQEVVTSLVSALHRGHWKRSPTPSGLYLGQKEELVPKWPTRHFVRGLTNSSDAQHFGQINLPTYSGGMPRPLCVRRCLHSPHHLANSPS